MQCTHNFQYLISDELFQDLLKVISAIGGHYNKALVIKRSYVHGEAGIGVTVERFIASLSVSLSQLVISWKCFNSETHCLALIVYVNIIIN